MITISIATHSDCALDTYNLIKRKLHKEGYVNVEKHLKIVPWRFSWLVKADQEIITALGWEIYTDLDAMIANQNEISAAVTV